MLADQESEMLAIAFRSNSFQEFGDLTVPEKTLGRFEYSPINLMLLEQRAQVYSKLLACFRDAQEYLVIHQRLGIAGVGFHAILRSLNSRTTVS